MMRHVLISLAAILLLTQSACETDKKQVQDLENKPGPTEYTFTRGGAPLEVIVRLSHDELELVEFLTLTIETRSAEGVQITPPYLSESVYSPLLLVENPRQETQWSEEKDRLINRWTYKLEPLISGDFKLNPFTINFRLDKEKTAKINEWPVYQVNTEAIPYKVNPSEIGDLDDIRDIKGLIYPPYKYWIPITTVSVLIMLGIGTFILLQLRQQRHPDFNGTIPLIDYYTDALNKLHSLEQQDYISKAEFKIFHTELTAILRNYLEHHFGLRANEQTSEEFIQDIILTRRFSEKQREELNQFLQLADLVKFATFEPGPQLSKSALDNVRTFVQTTGKPHEV